MAPRGLGQVHQVALEAGRHVDGAGGHGHLHDVFGRGHRLQGLEDVAAAVGAEDPDLALASRVADGDPHEEAVELAPGQGVGALVLHGVLRGEDHEGGLEGVGGGVDGDLPLLHGLQQRRLGLRGRPVDLVAEHQVGEHRPRAKIELAGGAVPHRAAHDIGGKQVGGELDPSPAAVERGGHRLGQAGLAHAGHVLDQDVAFGDQAQQDQLDHLGLALHDPLDVGGDGVEHLGEGLVWRSRRSSGHVALLLPRGVSTSAPGLDPVEAYRGRPTVPRRRLRSS